MTNKVEIRLFGEIGWEVSADNFVSELNQFGDDAELDIRIASDGGSVFEGLVIYNRLVQHKGTVTATVESLAASMASVIAMAADRVVMFDSSMMMIHNPATAAFGDQSDFRRVADTLDQIKDILLNAYERKSNLSREAISDLMDAETWMTPEAAVRDGFADEVISLNEDEDLDIAAQLASFDLSKFTNAPTIADAQGSSDALPQGIKFVLIDNQPNTNRTQEVINMKWYVIRGANGELTIWNTAADTDTIVATFDSEQDAQEYVGAKAPNITNLQTQAAQDAVTQERQRSADITALFSNHPGFEALRDECINGAVNASGRTEPCSLEQARERLLTAIGNQQDEEDGPEGGVRGSFVVVRDQRDKFRDGLTAALMCRLGLAEDDPQNQYRGIRSIKETARLCAIQAGVDVYSMGQLEWVGAAFSHSSSDFPALLENIMSKQLRAGFEEFPSTWQLWCETGEVSDFKQVSRINMGTFNNLDLVGEGGEFKDASISDKKEVNQASTKGNIFSVTRQTIINDDLSGMSRIASAMGQAARRTVNRDVYALLALNSDTGPTMLEDGTAMFTAGHGNLAGSGGAISATTISAGKAALRKMKGPSRGGADADGTDANLQIIANNLLVPVVLEDAAREFITSSTKDGQSNSRTPNVHQNSLEVISDPEIDDLISTTAWYLTSNRVRNIEVVFLDGQQTPFLDNTNGWRIDGTEWKVRYDYGVAGIEFRGMYRNAGA